ncbi:MAG: hypothetical protein EOO40_07455, partial [Deltaproteobacteria bacterium]
MDSLPADTVWLLYKRADRQTRKALLQLSRHLARGIKQSCVSCSIGGVLDAKAVFPSRLSFPNLRHCSVQCSPAQAQRFFGRNAFVAFTGDGLILSAGVERVARFREECVVDGAETAVFSIRTAQEAGSAAQLATRCRGLRVASFHNTGAQELSLARFQNDTVQQVLLFRLGCDRLDGPALKLLEVDGDITGLCIGPRTRRLAHMHISVKSIRSFRGAWQQLERLFLRTEHTSQLTFGRLPRLRTLGLTNINVDLTTLETTLPVVESIVMHDSRPLSGPLDLVGSCHRHPTLTMCEVVLTACGSAESWAWVDVLEVQTRFTYNAEFTA